MRKRKILIIDDEVDFCLLLTSFYSRKGYEVSFSHTLNEGLININRIIPDIIFLDNNLPDGLGWNAAAKIQREYPKAELNLISAYKSDVPHLADPAAVRILEKPLNLESLDLYY